MHNNNMRAPGLSGDAADHSFGFDDDFTPVFNPTINGDDGTHTPPDARRDGAQPARNDTNQDDTALFAWSSPVDGGAAQQATAGGTGSGGTAATVTTSATTSPFVINITWDTSVGAAPAAFKTGVLAAARYLQSQYTDAVTVNINVGYGEVAGSTLGSGALGASSTYLMSTSYTGLINALKADGKTTSDVAANASLATVDPTGGTYWTSTAQAKALGLMAAANTAVDGYAGFSSMYGFDYDNSNGVTAGTYDFNGVVLHELTEVMGRMLFTGGSIGTATHSYDALDLFHYAAAGVRDFSGSTPGYLSIDGGATSLAAFNTASGGDAGDWSSVVVNDAFDAFSNSGVVNGVSAADLTALDVIGWDRVGAGGTPSPPASTSTPTGVSISSIPASVAKIQSTTGLAAGIGLARAGQVGGASGDTYSYTLGGAAVGSFTLATSGNVATLSTGSSGVAGATNGRLYTLTVTAKDTTSGNAAPAQALDVIVGSRNGDTISAAALSGNLATATPAFIFGLAGNDRIDGTGMSGTLWITGGAGADTMTGGRGMDVYLYGAAGDSTASAMDIITNFAAGVDKIDLSGLGVTLAWAAQLASNATSLAAHAVGWQSSGGNTFVYVNTSTKSESLIGTNMKIELAGGVTLGTNDILHL